VFNVAHQADAVEVLRLDTVAVKTQRIGGAGQARVVAGLGGGGQRLQLERQRHVQPPAAGGAKGRQRAGKAAFVGAAVDGFIRHVLPRLRREQAVDQRRLAVGDGVANDGVAVGHGARRWVERL